LSPPNYFLVSSSSSSPPLFITKEKPHHSSLLNSLLFSSYLSLFNLSTVPDWFNRDFLWEGDLVLMAVMDVLFVVLGWWGQIIWFLIFCSRPCLVRENCRILQLFQILLELVMLKNHCFGKLSAHKWKSYQIGWMVAAIKPSIISASSIQNPFILPAVTQWASTSSK
jgi:hypothetical protein